MFGEYIQCRHASNAYKVCFGFDVSKAEEIQQFYSGSTKESADVIQRYVSQRRRQIVQERKITKFVEALWRCIFYSAFLIIGARALLYPDLAPWMHDSLQLWEGYPRQSKPPLLNFYYLIELGCYFHQLLWTEVTRSDAAEMIAHHIITILLVALSFLNNFTRIGTLILFIHDTADVFLEAAKCVNYASKAKGQKWLSTICDVLFAIFAIVFFVSRLVIYPGYVLRAAYIEAPAYFGRWSGYNFIFGLLVLLQLLHIFWFYLISRMIYKLLTSGIEGDVRSDDEEEEEDHDAAGDASTSKPKRS